jgi:hypothetical protein
MSVFDIPTFRTLEIFKSYLLYRLFKTLIYCINIAKPYITQSYLYYAAFMQYVCELICDSAYWFNLAEVERL